MQQASLDIQPMFNSQLKKQFEDVYAELAFALSELEKAAHRVNELCYSPNAKTPMTSCVYQSAVQKVLDEICKELTMAHKGESLAKLNKDDYTRFFGDSAQQGDLSDVDWHALAERLTEDAKALEAKGLTETADKLARMLGLTDKYGAPFYRGGHFVCTVDRYGDTYANRTTFARYKTQFKEVQTVTGESLNLPVFDDAIKALEALSILDDGLPSRTKFGNKSQALHLIWYNNKTEFCFSEPAFSALIAFIGAYQPDVLNTFSMPSVA